MLLVAGPDAAEYLQGQLTNDIEALAPERGCYAALLDRKGHIAGRHARPSARRPASSGSTSSPDPAQGVLKHLRTYSIGRDVEIADAAIEWSILSLIGPRRR